VFGSLSPSDDQRLIATRSACFQLRVAHFRVMAFSTFSGDPDYQFLLKGAAQESLKLLESFSSIPEMAKFGRAFLFNYIYAKTAAEASSENVEQWIGGTENDLDEVCPLPYESDGNKVTSRMARLSFHTKKLRSWVGERGRRTKAICI